MSNDDDRLRCTNQILAEACKTHRERISDLEYDKDTLEKTLKRYKIAKDLILVIGGIFALIEFYPF